MIRYLKKWQSIFLLTKNRVLSSLFKKDLFFLKKISSFSKKVLLFESERPDVFLKGPVVFMNQMLPLYRLHHGMNMANAPYFTFFMYKHSIKRLKTHGYGHIQKNVKKHIDE